MKLLAVGLAFVAMLQANVKGAEPIRALLVTGGCCHDYEHLKIVLTEGISARAKVTWTIVHEGGDSREHQVSIYTNANWAGGFDVVVHDECFGFVTNVPFIEQIARAHINGVPAVIIHCGVHSYRNAKTDAWRKVVGVSSYAHEKQRSFEVVNLKPEHPIMKGFPASWIDPEDELYQIKKLWPDCVPLAKGIGVTNAEHVCIWANTVGGTRVFGTTLGHGIETTKSEVYLDLVTRGLLWATGKLDENGKPVAGYAVK